jgi:hypothetical protein
MPGKCGVKHDSRRWQPGGDRRRCTGGSAWRGAGSRGVAVRDHPRPVRHGPAHG